MDSADTSIIRAFISEVMGYVLAIAVLVSIKTWQQYEKIIKAFLFSAMFIYLGAIWHLYSWFIKGEYITADIIPIINHPKKLLNGIPK